MDQFRDDERGVSESTGVAILIGMTVIVTATVGLNVLVVGEHDDGETEAEFTYDYAEEQSALLITYSSGDEIPAGELLIEGPDSEVTWAEASGGDDDAMIGPGDIVQISRQNAYGEPVSTLDTIHVYRVTEDDRTHLSQWPDE